jgi:protein disulfide-isomerase
MKTMVLPLLALCVAGQTMAADLQWLTSVPQAMAQAKAENKAVLLDFTGSDWCSWCKKLDADTFSKPEFIEYASQHLVLVMVDFPRKTTPQPEELKEANKALAEKYSVHGYPSLVELSPDGTVLCKQTGYLKGGPAAMIAKLSGTEAKTAVREPGSPAPALPAPVAVSYDFARVVRKPGDEPKLQGIFWSSSHPSILLQGKNCEEGDSVEGMHVLKIARDKVTVEWKGKTEELTMK